MSSVFSISSAGLNGAVRQFEAAASRIAGGSVAAAAPAQSGVEAAGLRSQQDIIGDVADLTVARHSFAANAKVLSVVSQTQKALLDIKI